MIDSAIVLLREQGAAATTIDAVLAHSGAPRGSVYHHFPGGRRELVFAAVTRAGEIIGGLVRRGVQDGGDAVGVLDRFAEVWRAQLVASDYRAGCPLLAVAVDHDLEDAELSELVAAAMQGWVDDLAGGLVATGFARERAARLATVVLAAMEGAVVLCRQQSSAGPLDAVVAELRPLLAG